MDGTDICTDSGDTICPQIENCGGHKNLMSTHKLFHGEIKLLSRIPSYKGPVVQSIVSLISLLMTNLLTIIAKVLSNTLIFLLLKCELLTFVSAKNINVLAIFQDRNFNLKLANNSLNHKK